MAMTEPMTEERLAILRATADTKPSVQLLALAARKAAIHEACDEIDRLRMCLSREQEKIIEASKYILFLAKICDGTIPADAAYAVWRKEHSLEELMSET